MQDIWGLCLKRLRNFSERVKGVGGVFYERKKTSNSLFCGWGEVIRKESEARRNSVSLLLPCKSQSRHTRKGGEY